MSKRTYYQTASTVFLIVGLAHLLRILNGWEAEIGELLVPMWFSWAAVVIAGYLAWRGFSYANKLSK
jgi:hypothetical protein